MSLCRCRWDLSVWDPRSSASDFYNFWIFQILRALGEEECRAASVGSAYSPGGGFHPCPFHVGFPRIVQQQHEEPTSNWPKECHDLQPSVLFCSFGKWNLQSYIDKYILCAASMITFGWQQIVLYLLTSNPCDALFFTGYQCPWLSVLIGISHSPFAPSNVYIVVLEGPTMSGRHFYINIC